MTTACTRHQQTTGIHLENLDTTVLPQNDFYQFACGGWMAANPLTPEYSRFGSFDKLGLQNLEQVNGLIQSIAAQTHPQGSVEQKIGDLYNLSMDTARRDQEGTNAVQKTLNEIEAITSKDHLSEALGKAMDFGLWAMYVDADAMNSSMNILNEYQAGFTLGEKEYYIDTDAINVHSLMSIGILKEHIFCYPGCTFCGDETFFSYRRDGETGRMCAVIELI